jgi:hypothetical protein
MNGDARDTSEPLPEALMMGDTSGIVQVGDRLLRALRAALPAGVRDAVKQLLILFSAFVAYDMIRVSALGREVDAIRHSEALVHLERALHIFWEPAMQAAALDTTASIDTLNWVYSRVHLPAIAITLGWIYLRHFPEWRLYRNAFLLMNFIGVTVFALLPLAPPRLVVESTMIDTKYLVSGHEVHSGVLSFVTNPYAAMPSLHLGFALFTSLALWNLARGRAARICAVVYAFVILVSIVTTGNHYLLDGLAGAATLALAFALSGLIERRLPPRPGGHDAASGDEGETTWD